MFLSFCYKVRKERHGKLLDRVGINAKFIFWFEDNTHYKYRPLDNQVTYRPKNFFCERVLRRLKETLSIFSSKTDSHHAGFYAFTPLLDVCFHRIEALLFMEAHNIHLIDLS